MQADLLPSEPPGKPKNTGAQYSVFHELSGKPYLIIFKIAYSILGFSGGSDGKELPAMQETCVGSLGWKDPLEKGKATHSSILAQRIPWTEGSGQL